MKICELEKGMMIRPKELHRIFVSRSEDWLNVGKIKKSLAYRRHSFKVELEEASKQIAIYLGNRKDVGKTEPKWCDKFVLFEGKILAVDPYAWRKMEIFNEK
jgi:hypothetical protein